jgi:hypothetical protein
MEIIRTFPDITNVQPKRSKLTRAIRTRMFTTLLPIVSSMALVTPLTTQQILQRIQKMDIIDVMPDVIFLNSVLFGLCEEGRIGVDMTGTVLKWITINNL